MDSMQVLHMMNPYMDLEPAEDLPCRNRLHKQTEPNISQAQLPNGKRINLLKTLLTSACERNCFYCPFRIGRDFHREKFTPEELAKLFMGLVRSGIVQGLFLSSGIAGGGMRTQDRLLDTAYILRHRLGYRGYIHLKIMPGAERDQVYQAMLLANRVSINLEAPTDERLELLAPRKQFMSELMAPLQWIEEIRSQPPPVDAWRGHWASSATQFVVGAVGETDVELLQTTSYLHASLRLSRVYFSSFNPIADTPLENLPHSDPQREHRLYQAAYLLRDYGFQMEELAYDHKGFLHLDTDPKLVWANQNLRHSPIEINQASPRELIRIPGIGPKSAQRIIRARRQIRLVNLDQLGKLGVKIHKMTDFILLDGRRPAFQQTFW